MAGSDHKYKTGEYHVLLFNEYGSRVAERPAANWTAANLLGEEWVANGRAFSYVTIRTVFNSLDGHSTGVRNLEETEE